MNQSTLIPDNHFPSIFLVSVWITTLFLLPLTLLAGQLLLSGLPAHPYSSLGLEPHDKAILCSVCACYMCKRVYLCKSREGKPSTRMIAYKYFLVRVQFYSLMSADKWQGKYLLGLQKASFIALHDNLLYLFLFHSPWAIMASFFAAQ